MSTRKRHPRADLDCTDIRALLSGIVDDELPADGRHRAERHLADCAACRHLVDEAEGLDALVALEGAELVPDRLPRGFEGAVLGRTVFDQPRHGSYFRQWTTWAGWMAAAAAIVLAVVIWASDHGGLEPARAPLAGGLRPATYATGTEFRSAFLDEPLPAEVIPAALGRRDDLRREDSETLYLASIILDRVEIDQPLREQDLSSMRRAIEYDGLIERMRAMRPRLAASDRAAVLAAESLLVRLGGAPLSGDDVDDIGTTAHSLDLAATLDGISRRWTGTL